MFRIFHRRPKSRRQRPGMGVPGKGAATPPHQLGDLGERCELPAGFVAEPRPPKGFSIIFTTQDGLSWQCNIVNCGLSCSQWGPITPCPPCGRPWYIIIMKKSARRDANTDCALAVVRQRQKFSPHRRPTSRWRRMAKI